MKKFVRPGFAGLITLLASLPAFAEEAGHAGGSGLYALAAGLAIGVAALGGALGQGKAIAGAMDGIARNPAAEPKMFKSLILGLALVESLVLFALVIAFQLYGKA